MTQIRFHRCLATVLAAAMATVVGAPVLQGEILVQSDVFVGGSEGPQGTSNYRIPGMAIASDGSVLAFAEGRRNGSDAGAGGYPIDMVTKRSTDGGHSWEPLVVLHANSAFDYSDPRPIVDQTTGNVQLLYTQWPDNCGQTCVPGGLGDDSSVVFLQTSADNGQSWSGPANINAQVKDPTWRVLNTGPGSGIQLRWQVAAERNGRLVDPAHRDDGGFRGVTIYRDDGGATWQAGTPQAGPAVNESEVVELTNGDLLWDGRTFGGPTRERYISHNGGETWGYLGPGDIPVTRVDTSMARYSAVRDGHDRNRIVYSAPLGDPPGSGNNRTNIGVWTSYDEGQTFINPHQLGTGHAAYSDVQRLGDGTIGLLYEATSSTLIRFIGFDVAELEGADHPAPMSHYDGFGNPIDAFRGGVGWSGGWENAGVTTATGGLEFPGFFTAGDDQHVNLRGAEMTRHLGSGAIDLNQNEDFFVSLFVNHDSADGENSGSEFLDVLLQDATGTMQAAFGIGSGEHFFVNGLGGVTPGGPGEAARDTTYLLLAKIAAQDDSSGDHFDQLFLAWYDDPAAVPGDESQVTWQLVSATSENSNTQIDRLQVSAGSDATWLFDGLRIGTTFDAVIVDTGVAAPLVLGDLNSDRFVNLADWLVFRANMTLDTSELSDDDRVRVGDFDVDGFIGPWDFLAFVDFYDEHNGDNAFAALAVVPEPGSWLLFLVGSIALVWRSLTTTRAGNDLG